MSSRLFSQLVVLGCLAGLFVAFSISAANPPSATPANKYSKAECRQMVTDVTSFTKRYAPGRINQFIQCQAKTVVFQIHQGNQLAICSAAIHRYYRKFVVMFSRDCFTLTQADHRKRPSSPTAPSSGQPT